MSLRIETECIFWELTLGIRDDWDSNRVEYEPKVLAIDLHLYISLPFFRPDKQHINWVKEAWGMMPKPIVQDNPDYDDPLPF